jgi:hypothetical protein
VRCTGCEPYAQSTLVQCSRDPLWWAFVQLTAFILRCGRRGFAGAPRSNVSLTMGFCDDASSGPLFIGLTADAGMGVASEFWSAFKIVLVFLTSGPRWREP